jgi:glycine/D-amino acid oxidase-like deaminating enzyme
MQSHYSYWEKNYWFGNYDYVIVGAGLVGICSSLAIKNKFPESRVLVLERGQLPLGASTRNAGFACFATIGEILDDLSQWDEDTVIETIALRWQGLQKLRALVNEEQVDYQNRGGYEIVDDQLQFDQYQSHLKHINALIEEATGLKHCIKVERQDFSKAFFGQYFFNEYEAQLNPGLLVRQLYDTARNIGVEFCFNFCVKQYESGDKYIVHSENGLTLAARHIIFGTNAFTNRILKGMDITPCRNQVFISKPMKEFPWKACYHYDQGYTYFRAVNNCLLIGGGRNMDMANETTDEFGSNESIEHFLRDIIERLGLSHPFELDCKWSGIIATGASKRPIIERQADGSYVAVRLGGMGVAIAAGVADKLVAML